MRTIEQNAGSLWWLFESHLISRNYAQNTVNAYRWDVTQFMDWVDNRKASIQTITPTDITDYLSQLAQDSVAPSSRGRKLFAIRSFLGFLVDTQHLKKKSSGWHQSAETRHETAAGAFRDGVSASARCRPQRIGSGLRHH